MRDEVEGLIEQLHQKCNELKIAVRRLGPRQRTDGRRRLEFIGLDQPPQLLARLPFFYPTP
jgi:hypothetical protein